MYVIAKAEFDGQNCKRSCPFYADQLCTAFGERENNKRHAHCINYPRLHVVDVIPLEKKYLAAIDNAHVEGPTVLGAIYNYIQKILAK
jgi:phosphotransferase system IIB component